MELKKPGVVAVPAVVVVAIVANDAKENLARKTQDSPRLKIQNLNHKNHLHKVIRILLTQ